MQTNGWEATYVKVQRPLAPVIPLPLACVVGRSKNFLRSVLRSKSEGRGKTRVENGNHLGEPEAFLRPTAVLAPPRLCVGSPVDEAGSCCQSGAAVCPSSALRHTATHPTRHAVWPWLVRCFPFLGRAPGGGHTILSTALNAAFRRRQTVWADPAPSSDNGLLAFLSVFSASSSSFPFSLSVSLSLSPPHTPRGMYIPHARVRTGNFLNDHICLGVFPNGSVSTHIICSFLFVTTLLKNRVFFFFNHFDRWEKN